MSDYVDKSEAWDGARASWQKGYDKAKSEAAAYIDRLEEALQEWRAARLATTETGIGHADYMIRLNRLSEAEDALNTLARNTLKGGNDGK